MPNLDGFKLIEMIHQKGIIAPIIFLTGSTSEQDEVRGFELGAVDYIRKPIRKELLLSRVGNALNCERKGKRYEKEPYFTGLTENEVFDFLRVRQGRRIMAYLLYGIVKAPVIIVNPGNSGDTIRISTKSGHVPGIMGVKGKPVIFVEDHGLCAAVSELDVVEGAPPVAELFAYAQVVEALHHRQTVIPMRYGCFLNGIPAIRDVLKARQRQYETLLAELEGHAEIGIRIILPEKGRTKRHGETSLHSDALSMTGSEKENPAPEAITVPKEKSAINGRAYLALRRVHYRMQEETTQGRQALIDCYMNAFSGLYSRHRTEMDAKKDAVIVSLYFLTPKGAVSRFRQIFEDVREKKNAEAMLSGPWPPYNFAAIVFAPAKDLP